jgi:hypothetical protein
MQITLIELKEKPIIVEKETLYFPFARHILIKGKPL